MTHVATLIVDPAAETLRAEIVAAAAASLPHAAPPIWLAPRIAADIPFAPPVGSDNARWAEAARRTLDGAPIDVVVQPSAGRRKRLLMTDMDSTVIEQECIDELAAGVGLRERVAAITERSMRGEINFEQSLMERVRLLRGLYVGQAAQIVTQQITLMPGAKTLLRTMRANNVLTVLASGGFTLFTSHVGNLLGFDRHYGNTLEIEAGRLTGSVQQPIFGRASKRAILRALRDEYGLPPEATIAAGDGANDLAMLEEAGLGVAFRAKPAVAAVARARIDHADLSALLYIQGYAAHEMVA